jgi:hypothetical protein
LTGSPEVMQPPVKANLFAWELRVSSCHYGNTHAMLMLASADDFQRELLGLVEWCVEAGRHMYTRLDRPSFDGRRSKCSYSDR